jgi:hypothetical protein
LLFHSADAQLRLASRWAPVRLKQYVLTLTERLQGLQHTFDVRGGEASQLRHAFTLAGLNLLLVAVIVGVGTVVLQFSTGVAGEVGLGESLLGLIVAAAVIALCAPSAVIVWRQLHDIADVLTKAAFGVGQRRRRQREEMRLLVRDSLVAAIAILVAVWALPFLARLLELGQLSVPLPLLLLAGLVFVLVRTAFKVHAALQDSLSKTMLGRRDQPSEPADEERLGD